VQGRKSSPAAREQQIAFVTELAPALRSAAERLFEAGDDPARVRSLFDRNDMPMVLFDNDRCYRDANRPARLLFRKSLEELRALRIEDLAPPGSLPEPERTLDTLLEQGFATGKYEMGFEDGSRLPIVYYTLVDALPGLNLSVFLPEEWSEQELLPASDDRHGKRLTDRELQVLKLASSGASGPEIANLLVISPTTVKTHFENIYRKLGVPDRASAVANALRLGLID
jgi:DNA-binding CsgD family transcriptional regulator